MEARLVPLNALLALVIRDEGTRPVLLEAGFKLAGLEVGVVDPDRKGVTIDAVLWHAEAARLLYCEAKSGNNVDEGQAKKYMTLTPVAVMSSAFARMTVDVDPTGETVYVCLGECLDRIQLGLSKLSIEIPIIVVYDNRVELANAGFAGDLLREALRESVSLDRPPPRLVPFDDHSDIDTVQNFVHPVLVKAMVRRLPSITIEALTEQATPHFAMYSTRAKGDLVKQVGAAAIAIADADQERFRYVPAAGSKRSAYVEILKTPEEYDPPQRTRGYQAIPRQGMTYKRGRKNENPDQMDLLAELGSTDTEESDPLPVEEAQP